LSLFLPLFSSPPFFSDPHPCLSSLFPHLAQRTCLNLLQSLKRLLGQDRQTEPVVSKQQAKKKHPEDERLAPAQASTSPEGTFNGPVPIRNSLRSTRGIRNLNNVVDCPSLAILQKTNLNIV